MRKIGFIDHYIDEWHANNYPAWIRESSLREEFDVFLAWEEVTPEGRKSLDRWCAEQGVGKASSIEEVVSGCHALVVLSPDNPERHEDLADLPLRSGKPVYIDKPIAPTLAAARRLFAKAERNGTPLMSCSALRYGSAIESATSSMVGRKAASYVATRGEGEFEVYAIHQVEMLVMVLGVGASRVMQCGNEWAKVMVVDYPDGRRGSVTLMPEHPFQFSARCGAGSLVVDSMDGFFPRFIEAMLRFFRTGVSPIPKEQTLEIVALLEAGAEGLLRPDSWMEVGGR